MCMSNSDDKETPVRKEAINELIAVLVRRLQGEITSEDARYLISKINTEG